MFLQIKQLLGDGTFGRVLECEDTGNNNIYAMKVIRPVERYIESAKIESLIICNINSQDKENKAHAIQITDSFTFGSCGEQYYAMIFERLGASLYEFLKENNYRGFSMTQIQAFAKQIFEGLGTLHSMGIIHSDLKPENILFTTRTFHTIYDKEKWPKNVKFKEKNGTSETSEKAENTGYNQIDNTEIKIIDFGGAVYTSESCTGIINTRQYRAPEVILRCCRWGTESDIWSIACILVELYTGDLFFATHENEEHLCLIEKACGPFPDWMVSNRDKCFDHLFYKHSSPVDKNDNHFLTCPEESENYNKIKEALKTQESLDEVVVPEHKKFADFLRYLFVIDPKKRPTCSEILRHSFFEEKFED